MVRRKRSGTSYCEQSRRSGSGIGSKPALPRRSHRPLSPVSESADGGLGIAASARARLHALFLRAARFEVARRRPSLPHLRGNELEEIALEAAGDAAISVLARLDDFRGHSRFTTWAYKFALLEAAVKLRKRAWQGREVLLEPENWTLLPTTGLEPAQQAEQTRCSTPCRTRSRRRSRHTNAECSSPSRSTASRSTS